MNSSSLSPLKNKSIIKPKQSSTLPPISSSQTLKYQNDYQSYQDQLNEYKAKRNQQSPRLQSSSVSKSSSIFSSSLSSGSNNSNSQVNRNKSNSKLQQQVSPSSIKSSEKIIPYQDSPNFWKSTQQQPYIQYSEHEQYKNKPTEQIERQLKAMRKQFIEMNKKLSSMLNEYNMARTQFVSKQLIAPSKTEFYIAQIQTNKKIQHAQVSQLKKLNQTQFLIKDKDVLLDLQQILIEMREQLHHGKKQQHDSKLKNHKKDIVLDEIIKTNTQNKDNNAVKLLKLQIIYYMKRQNSLKTYEEQLDHQQKLIRENDKNLQLKVEDMKKNNKLFYTCHQNYQRLKEKHQQLVQKKRLVKKSIQTITRSNQTTEQKLARQLLEIDTLLRKIIRPKIDQCQENNDQLQQKITTLINAYHLNSTSLKDISYKFSQDLIYNNSKNSLKPFLKSMLKPNFRPKSKIQQAGFLTQRKQEKKHNTKSNQKPISSQRYNDKNISMTIDVEAQHKVRSISQGLNNLKPKNFRIMSKRQNQNASKLDKHTSFSTTIDYGGSQTKTIQNNNQIQNNKFLKPNLLRAKGNSKQ